MLNRYTLFAVCLSLVTGCGSNSNGSTDSLSLDSAGPTETPAPAQPTDPTEPTPPAPAPASTFTIGLLPDTQGGTDAQGQAHVAMHPMDEVLKHQAGEGVDLVLALGDLTDNGSTIEWSEWRSVAQKYADQGWATMSPVTTTPPSGLPICATSFPRMPSICPAPSG